MRATVALGLELFTRMSNYRHRPTCEETTMPAAAETATRVERRDVAQTIFADGVFAARVVSGVARFDLFVTDPRPDGKMEPVVVGRLVVPLEALERFVRGMSM